MYTNPVCHTQDPYVMYTISPSRKLITESFWFIVLARKADITFMLLNHLSLLCMTITFNVITSSDPWLFSTKYKEQHGSRLTKMHQSNMQYVEVFVVSNMHVWSGKLFVDV